MRYENYMLKDGAVKLSEEVKLREEYFGGIVFHKNTGDILEVDREAYKMLKSEQKWAKKVKNLEKSA